MGRRAVSADMPARLGAGAIGGLIGGAAIWVYEAVVWSGVQQVLPLAAIAPNAVGLSFGPAAVLALGGLAPLAGAAIHFGFAALWGTGFALCWPALRARGVEATLAALVLTPVLWGVMHGAIILAGHPHPDYADSRVVIGGVFSHLFYTVPMALWTSRRLRAFPTDT